MAGYRCCWLAGVLVLGFVSRAEAVGILVPRDRGQLSGSYSITEHRVTMNVDGQICKVQVSQAFYNTSGRTLEVEYFFPLPADAAIDSFVMMVDGKEMPGRLLGREEARRIYEGIVRRKKDPALLEYMGRGLFKTSVFPLPAAQQRQINISFSRLCTREGNVVQIAYPLGTTKYSARPIRELSINCRISSPQSIKSVYSPTHEVSVKRPGERIAEVSLQQRDVLPQGDFAVMYTVSDSDVGLSVVSYRPRPTEPGYFLLLASPRIEHPESDVLSKSVIFVLDKSGSMTGEKIEQARRALQFVVRNLNRGDTFNIITYDSDIQSFAPELQAADPPTVERALAFVEQIGAGGSTNIDGALRTAMDMLKSPQQPAYIIFLTDGLPTAGEQREPAIVENCGKANRVRARLMAFGVGDDVNARLLDKLTANNFGNSHYVRPNQDIEAPVSKLYSKLSAPVLSHLSLEFDGLEHSLTYPKVLPDLFRGNQLVVVGRYHRVGDHLVRLRGSVGEAQRTFSQKVLFHDRQAPYSRAFIEKLWAERRVGYLIDEIDLHGRNQELIDEIVRLSTRYGIMTPYTSFLADEEVELADLPAIRGKAAGEFAALDMIVSGTAGVGQRVSKRRRMEATVAPAPGRQMAVSMEGAQEALSTVFGVGGKTFYRKKGQWQDGEVTPEQREQARKLVQFSDEYFDVLRALEPHETQYFALEGELLVTVRGTTYWVVPAE